jgi:sirohydrochlorin ferrochelatase
LPALLAGYSLAAWIVLSRKENRALPPIKRTLAETGKGHRAVIYFTHGESELYAPQAWINQFQEFDAQRIRFIPFLVRPFFLYKLRQNYLAVGRSDHVRMHARMVKALAQTWRESGDTTTRFYLSFLDVNPRPDEMAIRAINEGASEIILLEVFLTQSNHNLEGEVLVREIRPEQYGVQLRITRPLWDSPLLQQSFVDKALEACGDCDLDKVGILLVGHGQPTEWDVEFATESQQETEFRMRIVEHLAAEGFLRENIGMAWMEFREPKPAARVEEMLKRGIDKVLIFSTAISADGLHSQFDVPALAAKAHLSTGKELINLGAWNDHPMVIQALKNRLEEVL